MIPLSLPLAAVALLAQTRTATVLSIGDGDTLRPQQRLLLLKDAKKIHP